MKISSTGSYRQWVMSGMVRHRKQLFAHTWEKGLPTIAEVMRELAGSVSSEMLSEVE
jgi:hypothetical protein